MSIYTNDLRQLISGRNDIQTPEDTFDYLLSIGVLDEQRIRIFTIRAFVDHLVKSGTGKVDAMFITADKFSCTYECVREYIYYYKDINL